jgi:hypothetical protein
VRTKQTYSSLDLNKIQENKEAVDVDLTMDDEEKGLCTLCVNDRSSYMFSGCNHVCFCDDCAKYYMQKACPLCNTRGVLIKVYI